MTIQQEAPSFEQMPFYINEDAENFVPLLAHLSKGFAAKDPETQLNSVVKNLDLITENASDTAVFVYAVDLYPGETNKKLKNEQQIVSTATANRLWTPSPEGWVDDVVTLPDYQGKGLGRGAMGALHEWFKEQGVSVVRLTSAGDREAAGDLYSKLGYFQDGQVWRASIDDTNMSGNFDPLQELTTMPDLHAMYDLATPPSGRTRKGFDEYHHNIYGALKSDTSQVIIGRDDEGEITRSAMATNCRIPTGNKAWLYGLNATNVGDLVSIICDAHSALEWDGVTSSNVMTFGESDETLVTALRETGYEPRDTRLYTLDLSQQQAAA